MIRKGLIFHAVFTLYIGQRLVLEPDKFPECTYLTCEEFKEYEFYTLD